MAQFLDYNGIKEFHQKIVGAPIVDESEYIFGVKDNKLVRIPSDVFDNDVYTFDMSLITSSSDNVGVRFGIQDMIGNFVNIPWTVQGEEGYSGTQESIFYVNNATEHNYSLQVSKKRLGDNVLRLDINTLNGNVNIGYNACFSPADVNISTNMPLMNLAWCFSDSQNWNGVLLDIPIQSVTGTGINPTTLALTFRSCTYLTSLDGIANWDTGNVTNMTNTFQNCQNLTNVDGLANWNVSMVVTLGGAFHNCHGITTLVGLANWDTSKVTETCIYGVIGGLSINCGLFQNCIRLTDITALNNWSSSMSANWYNGFRNCTNIAGNVAFHFNITCAAYMFADRSNAPMLNIYASTSTNAYNALYRAMDNATTNSSWNVTLYELEE